MIENEKALKMKYVVFKIDDIKQILNTIEQQCLWSMLDKIVQHKQTEADKIQVRTKSENIAKRILTKMLRAEIKKKFPMQSKEIEQLLDKNGLINID